MYRVWYSTEEFADYIIANTSLINESTEKKKLLPSDANNGRLFHTMPDHLRKILYLDCPDIIVEKDGEPLFSIEESKEAGTGHNVFQRFARLAASVENKVPAFFIYPQAKLVYRESNDSIRWDNINPLIFKAMDSMMALYEIPAFLFYFPSVYGMHEASAYIKDKGLLHDKMYSACPASDSPGMKKMFDFIDCIVDKARNNVKCKYLQNSLFRDYREWMLREYGKLIGDKDVFSKSPLSSVKLVPTEVFIKYLSKQESSDYHLGAFLKSRKMTAIYCVNAAFRGDPYPGALAAVDYILCREGQTYEDRSKNLVLLFGELNYDEKNEEMSVLPSDKIRIDDFFEAVKASEQHNLLTRGYMQLKNFEIPRYMMQVRYGSTYSKVKHIRVYSYFADAILFPDGELWRDA